MSSFKLLTAGVVAAALLLQGCQTTEGYQGAGLGCVVAGGAALVFGASAKNAGIACAAGAVVGGAAGDYVGRERQKYASAEAFYEAEIASAQAYGAGLRADINSYERDIAVLQQDVDALKKSEGAAAANRQALRTKRAEIDGQITEIEAKIAEAEAEIEIKTAVADDMRTNESLAELQRMDSEIAFLQTSIDIMRNDVTRLAGMRDALV